MRKSMNRLYGKTSSNPRTSHHGVEIETQFESSHIAKRRTTRQ